jgi:hypothetical protein
MSLSPSVKMTPYSAGYFRDLAVVRSCSRHPTLPDRAASHQENMHHLAAVAQEALAGVWIASQQPVEARALMPGRRLRDTPSGTGRDKKRGA